MLVHRRFNSALNLPAPSLHLGGERHCPRVSCLAQEHNAISTARARTQTAASRLVNCIDNKTRNLKKFFGEDLLTEKVSYTFHKFKKAVGNH